MLNFDFLDGKAGEIIAMVNQQGREHGGFTVNYIQMPAEVANRLKNQAKREDWASFLPWGTRGPNCGGDVQETLLKRLDTSHLENILATQVHIPVAYKMAIMAEIEVRREKETADLKRQVADLEVARQQLIQQYEAKDREIAQKVNEMRSLVRTGNEAVATKEAKDREVAHLRQQLVNQAAEHKAEIRKVRANANQMVVDSALETQELRRELDALRSRQVYVAARPRPGQSVMATANHPVVGHGHQVATSQPPKLKKKGFFRRVLDGEIGSA